MKIIYSALILFVAVLVAQAGVLPIQQNKWTTTAAAGLPDPAKVVTNNASGVTLYGTFSGESEGTFGGPGYYMLNSAVGGLFFNTVTQYGGGVFFVDGAGNLNALSLTGSLNGTNIQSGTVNSNALDAATKAMLGAGGGTTYTNNTTPAGVITGAGIGTNTTSFVQQNGNFGSHLYGLEIDAQQGYFTNSIIITSQATNSLLYLNGSKLAQSATLGGTLSLVGGTLQDNGVVTNGGTINASTVNATNLNLYGSMTATNPANIFAGTIVGGNGVTNYTLANIWYVSKSGNNSTATNGRPDYSSLTISNAVLMASNAFAISGTRQLIYVYPGVYNENDLRRNGLDYYGSPGADIFYQHATTNDAGWGVFDDRRRGGCTNYFDWHGTLAIQGFTNFGIYGNSWYDDTLVEDSPNTLGVIVQTNPASIMRGGFYGYISTPFYGAGSSQSAFLYYKNGQDLQAKSDLYIAPIDGCITNWVPIYYNEEGVETGIVQIATCNASGIYWEQGDLHINCPNILAMNYSIYGLQTQTNRVNHFDFDGDQLYGKIYWVAANQNYVFWPTFNQIQPTPYQILTITDDQGFITNIYPAVLGTYSGGYAIDIYGSGKFYFQKIGKVEIPGSEGGIDLHKANATDQPPAFWYSGQKMSANSGGFWVKQDWGQLIMDVQDFSSESGGGGGLFIYSNSVFYAKGHFMDSSNNLTIVNQGATPDIQLNGYSITNTSGLSALTVGGAGLTLGNVKLMAPSGVSAITSSVPETVTMNSVYVSTFVAANIFANTIGASVFGVVEANSFLYTSNVWNLAQLAGGMLPGQNKEVFSNGIAKVNIQVTGAATNVTYESAIGGGIIP